MTIDESTGTVALRAEVPNPDHLLLPGQFVRARINAGTRPSAIAIPQRAVIVGDNSASVKLVGDDDQVSTRAVELGPLQGSRWLIRSGLEDGDVIIVEGGQNARDGQPVRTKPWEPPAEAAEDEPAPR